MRSLAAVASISVCLGAPPLAAQTQTQLAEEAEFHRDVVQAKKAGDCKKAIQLIDDRTAVLREKARTITNTKGYRAAEPSVGEMSEILYLTTEMQGLENRRILETRDCKKN